MLARLQFISIHLSLSNTAWLPAQRLRTPPARRRWCTRSHQHLGSENRSLPCWRTCRTCFSLPPGGTASGTGPVQFYSWGEPNREVDWRWETESREKLRGWWWIWHLEGGFTWAGRGTDPKWAQREPETLFCPAEEESSPGCNALQSPRHNNTPVNQRLLKKIYKYVYKWNYTCSKLTGNLLGNLDRILHTSSFLVAKQK